MPIVTKLEAASRQLDEAIRLFFAQGDAIATHTLAVAAANILADIVEKKDGVSWRTRAQDDSKIPMHELKYILHQAWNFFKHADQDANGILYFNEREAEDFIFLGVQDYGYVHSATCTMQAFHHWYIATHHNCVPGSGPTFSEAQRLFPGIADLPRPQQMEQGAQFLRDTVAKTP